ncbi:hypothetical protein AN639_08225 [Candidatus Epulonipiscium fishelsonii]|uniref:Uncharacterized protein n=1 Tax=Candidatus Epulonipiscium fishelsonii TaxID=77094 RepID=A0ACC8XC59_9FIRM|nr:hypothetical protein AN639_08225 [Epulopiscium sp. SCG-B05WGA-EpuloA1]ONI40078.1 hypothetical protein AN396_06415 [Epulopiscium sp. SCG-B11WGA-EpuloA1]
MLKLTAVLFMTMDHLAAGLFSVGLLEENLYIILRTLGRLAMPIFAYQIAYGFIKTSNYQKYLTRLTIMTIVAQVPFFLLMNNWRIGLDDLFHFNMYEGLFSYWNIGLTFMSALIILKLTSLEKNVFNYTLSFLAILIIIIFSDVSDYGLYGILTVLVFYVAIKHSFNFNKMFFIFLILNICFNELDIQTFSVFSVLLIKYIPHKRFKHDKWLFYIFYPTHMLIIYFITQLV